MARSRRLDEADADADRSPRKRKKGLKKARPSAAVNRRWLLVGVAGGAVVGVAAVVALVVFLCAPPRPPAESPQAVFDDFQDAVAANDHGRVFDRLHPDGLDLIGAQIEVSLTLEPEMRKHKGKKGRDLWVAYCQEQEKKGLPPYGLMERWRKPAAVQAVTVDGDTATLTVTTHDGASESVRMKKHNDEWRYRHSWFGH